MPNLSDGDRINELERRITELEQQVQPRIKELKSQVQLLSRELRQRRNVGNQIATICAHAWEFPRTIEELPIRELNMMPLLLEKWNAIKKADN